MSGLILLFILCAWGFASYSLAKLIAQPIKTPNIKTGVNIALLVLIFIAPVADDIIGGFQFRALCRESAVITIDEEKARGKSVLGDSKNIALTSYMLPINNRHAIYRDTDTKEILLSWNEYRAKGGWLSRLIGFPQGSPPYTFNGVCYPKEAFGRKNIFDRLDISN